VRTTRLWPIAAVLLATTILAGCGGKSSNASGSLGQIGASSSAPVASGGSSAGPSATTEPPSGGSTSSPPPPSYPKTAQGYADALISAYDNHRASRLADLSSTDAVTNFGTFGNPDKHWHFHKCDGTAGTVYCTYDNNNGDRLQIMITSLQLGKPHAVPDVSLDKTKYYNTADEYVSAFVQAWTDDNARRLAVLSTSSVASHFTHLGPPSSTMLSDTDATPDADHTRVEIYDSIGGHTEYVEVATGKLGGPHAITGLGGA
jgi:hypothetical protein